MSSIALPKSQVSLTREDRPPHVFTLKTRLQPAEFLNTCAKRLLQHNLPFASFWHRSNRVMLYLMSSSAVVLAEREGGDPKLSYGALDPSVFKEDGGPSIAERINDELIAKKLVPFSAADNTRIPRLGAVGGWDQMRSRLVGKDGVPMIYCFSTCVDSIRTIPTLQHDPNRAEDVNTESEDHAADDWRYACMSRPWIKEKLVEEKDKSTSGYRPIDLVENVADWKTH
jgi:hypothetical protein